jgi:hypothetical protein
MLASVAPTSHNEDMTRQLRVFFAGRINPLSKHAAPFWREQITWQLNQTLKNYQVTDACLVPTRNRLIIEHNLPMSVLFSQSCFYIQHSDLLVVNLTDDISIGGSQEIFIAKQLGIPVIGLAPPPG